MNKKEREFNCFSNFSKLYFGHTIQFHQPDPPQPDIVFELDNKRIGCELTTVFIDNIPSQKSSATKANEINQDIICNNVENWLSRNVPAKFEIHIHFNNQIIPNSEIKTVTDKVIQIVETYIQELNLEEFSRITIEDYDIIPDRVGFMSIISFPGLEKNHVLKGSGSFIPKLDKERIISNIKHKEEFLKNYHHLTDNNWLVMTIHESIFSSEFDFTDEEYGDIKSNFDKVFVFSSREQKIVTIK